MIQSWRHEISVEWPVSCLAKLEVLSEELLLCRVGGGILGPRKDKPLQVFEAQPKTIRLVVMLSARFPRSLRNAVDLLRERGVEVSH